MNDKTEKCGLCAREISQIQSKIQGGKCFLCMIHPDKEKANEILNISKENLKKEGLVMRSLATGEIIKPEIYIGSSTIEPILIDIRKKDYSTCSRREGNYVLPHDT